jgi:outer membrane murein-binding lipoprotein Lpp
MKTKLFLSALILGSTLLSSCHSEKADSEQTTAEAADTVTAPEQIKKVFYSVPSPLQASMMLKKSGVQFNKSLLNPTKNEVRYTNSYKKSVNLGIYGADLAYCNMFNQTQEALNYMGAVNKIATAVGLSNIMEQTGIAYRFQSNLGNKDSLINILAQLYRESDEFLKENEQYNVAALSLAGGWIEALYIATEQSKKIANPALRQLIAEQKGSLNNMRKMLPVQSSEAEFTELNKQLDKLVELYAGVTMEQSAGETTTDEATKTTVVNGQTKVNMTDEQLSQIAAQVAVIRNGMTN